eukprot:gene5218-10442_t
MEQIMNRHKSRRRHRHPKDGKAISTLTDENYLKLNKTTVFHGKFPKIKELYCNDTGFFGNSQRNRCQKWEIDTCQYLIGQPLIQDIRWELKKRDADGIFIQNICNITAGKFIYIHIVASYHNGLKRLLHKQEFG